MDARQYEFKEIHPLRLIGRVAIMTPLEQLELIGALAYPVAIILSGLLANKTSSPTTKAASITELKQLILSNARLLKLNDGRAGSDDLRIVTFGSPAVRPTSSAFAWLRSNPKATLSAALISTPEDRRASNQVLIEGDDRPSVREALDSLLAVTSARLGQDYGNVVHDDGRAAQARSLGSRSKSD